MARKTYKQISLSEKIFRECDVMLKHATSKGLSVPPALVRDFTVIGNRTPELDSLKLRHRDFLSTQKIEFTETDLAMLSNIHFELSRTVAPATPYTLLFLQSDAENSYGRFQVFGAVPLVRRLLLMSIFCLLVLLSFAFIPNANQIIGGALLSNAEFDLVLSVVFRLAAAGLGASFYALHKAKGYVSNYTFDPAYEGTYWTEFILGLMAGLIFSTMLDGQGQSISDATGGSGVMMAKITIALLGGFSSNVVYEFLNRTVQALASIFKADPKQIIEAEVNNVKASIENSFAKKRQTILNHLSDLQSDIFTGNFSKEGVGGRVKDLIEDLTQGENTGYLPQTKKKNPNIPDHVPGSNEVRIDVEDIDPMSVAAIHQDDLLEADEEEYVEVFDTRA